MDEIIINGRTMEEIDRQMRIKDRAIYWPPDVKYYCDDCRVFRKPGDGTCPDCGNKLVMVRKSVWEQMNG